MNKHFSALEERARLEVAILDQIAQKPNITATELSKLFKTTDTNIRKMLLPYLKEGQVKITNSTTISYRISDAN
jgi:DeoR/GlpR family transcriptional regulator of sugar metabolism